MKINLLIGQQTNVKEIYHKDIQVLFDLLVKGRVIEGHKHIISAGSDLQPEIIEKLSFHDMIILIVAIRNENLGNIVEFKHKWEWKNSEGRDEFQWADHTYAITLDDLGILYPSKEVKNGILMLDDKIGMRLITANEQLALINSDADLIFATNSGFVPCDSEGNAINVPLKKSHEMFKRKNELGLVKNTFYSISFRDMEYKNAIIQMPNFFIHETSIQTFT